MSSTEEEAVMKQIKIRKPVRKPEVPPLDLRTPTGTPLPW
jgi:hypothetical protein